MAKHTYSLEKSYTLTIGDSFKTLEKNPDVIKQLLRDTRCEGTRRCYEKDLRDFFCFSTGKEPNRDTVLEFLHLTQGQAVALVLDFKSYLMNERRFAENTVNRKLAAIRSMVTMGRKLGVYAFALDDVKSEIVQKYRDTSGIEAREFAKVLSLVDRSTLKGKRDYAILRLLWDNALRRNEIYSLDVDDFNPQAKTITIYGKGKGTQKTVIELTQKTTEAIIDWIKASKKTNQEYTPLFGSLSPRKGDIEDRLIGESIRRLVVKLCKKAGITKHMSPHRIRHRSITTALDHSNGNYRKV
ncbi:integrase-recombinase protein (plasmid) [Calothrix sp. PCC 7716]|nr:integrase-recombinase protein [Calothrix sp. PCC 7716]